MVETPDGDSVDAWLKTQSREVCIAIAMRSALRATAILGVATKDTSMAALSLSAFRGVLSAGVASVLSDPGLREAAAFAAARSVRFGSFGGYSLAAESAFEAVSAVNVGEAAAARAVRAAAEAALYAGHELEELRRADSSVAEAAAAKAEGATYAAFSGDAGRFEAGASAEAVFAAPPWEEGEEPPALSEARERLLAFLDAEPEVWGFWKRWYQGMFEGRPMGWDLQRRVALIPETVWQEGPASVAAEIARIEAAFGPITPQAAKAQANRLKERPVVAATAAKGLAAIIQMATDAYRREVCNALPEALEPLERLPGLLDTIAVKVISDCPEDELAQLVVMMGGTIAELNLRLRRAREEVKSRPVADEKRGRRSLIREGFYTNIGGMMSGALFSTALWGALFAGSQTLIGPAAADLVDGLGQCYEDMIGPEADTPPELWALPSLDA